MFPFFTETSLAHSLIVEVKLLHEGIGHTVTCELKTGVLVGMGFAKSVGMNKNVAWAWMFIFFLGWCVMVSNCSAAWHEINTFPSRAKLKLCFLNKISLTGQGSSYESYYLPFFFGGDPTSCKCRVIFSGFPENKSVLFELVQYVWGGGDCRD